MSINRRIARLSRSETRTLIWCLLDVLFRADGRIDLEKEWNADTLQELSCLLEQWGLHPLTVWTQR
jgi:hypothetical protein